MLRQCLRSVRAAGEGLSIELIVVDNASWDGSCSVVATEYPEAKLILNSHNAGFAKACNQGIQVATGRYVLLLNSDARLLPDTLRGMAEFMEHHSTVGAAACRLRNEDGSIQASVRDFPSLRGEFFGALLLDRIFPSIRLIGGYRKQTVGIHEVSEVDQVAGAFLLVRREVVQEVGLLDERFFLYYEDVDWCLRIKRAGWSIMYVPEYQAVHSGGGSANQFRPFSYVEGTHSKLSYFRKHHAPLEARLATVFVMIEVLMRLAIWFSETITNPFRRARQTCKGWNPALAARICGAAWRHDFKAAWHGGGLLDSGRPGSDLQKSQLSDTASLKDGQLPAGDVMSGRDRNMAEART